MIHAGPNHFGHLSVATLVRIVPVRVLDVSRGGCRLETGRSLAPGVTARLSVQIAGRLRLDDVRVARCQQRAGAGAVYHVGAELLGTRRLHGRSVRFAVAQVIDEQARGSAQPDVPQSEPVPPQGEGRRDERHKGVSRAPPVPIIVGGS